MKRTFPALLGGAAALALLVGCGSNSDEPAASSSKEDVLEYTITQRVAQPYGGPTQLMLALNTDEFHCTPSQLSSSGSSCTVTWEGGGKSIVTAHVYATETQMQQRFNLEYAMAESTMAPARGYDMHYVSGANWFVDCNGGPATAEQNENACTWVKSIVGGEQYVAEAG